MTPPSSLAEARTRLAECGSLAAVEATLLELAPTFHDAFDQRCLVGERRELGVRVRSVTGGSSGLTAPGMRRPLILLRRDEPSARRRYTLAHELAHHVLASVDRAAVPLSRRREEWLCERFANRVLMPPALIADYFGRVGVPHDIWAVLAFARTFRVSVTAAVNGLSDSFPHGCGVAVLTSTYRGHPRRREEVAFRIDASATDPRMLAPRHRRLTSSGLRTLDAWAADAEPGDSGRGVDRELTLRPRRGSQGSWRGAAPWTAIALRAGRRGAPTGLGVLVVADIAALRPSPEGRGAVRRRSRASRPPSGQLQLVA